MARTTMFLVAFCLLSCAGPAVSQAPTGAVLTIQSAPPHPIIEQRNTSDFLNFDLIVKNVSPFELRISAIRLDVYDRADRLVLRKSVNTDAFAPSIAVIGKQTIATGESLDVFNPFSEFESMVPLTKVRFSFCLLRESNEREKARNLHRLPDDCDFQQEETVIPRAYETKTALILPLQGEVFVWEGHDFYAHHLRVPLGDPKVKSLGISANSNNFSSDFIYLDEHGMAYHDDPRRLENWYGYGKPVYAPGEGVVLATANDVPDNLFTDANATAIDHPKLPSGKDPKDIGNFVLIDHQNGEYSLLVHLLPGSVVVHVGDHIGQGQQVARIGFSGDSIFPHLHYSLMDGPEVYKAWGLPAYFLRFHRVLGEKSVGVARGSVNSGDFLESDAIYSNARKER